MQNTSILSVNRSFYSSPGQSNIKTSSIKIKRAFTIKSKIPSISGEQLSHSNSFHQIPEDLSKQGFTIKEGNFIQKRNEISHSMQNITMESQSLSPPKKYNPLAKLKPLKQHYQLKLFSSNSGSFSHLEDEISVITRGDGDISASVEERKEEEEVSPLMIGGSPSCLNLINHNLKDEMLEKFLLKIDGKTRQILLGNNYFGPLSSNILLEFINKYQKETQLVELDLEEAHITDEIAAKLFANLNKLKRLKALNLTSNYLSSQSSHEMKVFLANNTYLKELYLRRNKLMGADGTNIFQGLLLNRSLKVLDLSWNIMGTKACAEAFSKLIKEEKCPLIHVDLSYNNFSPKESQLISEALSFNHKLYGLHFEGNSAYINSQGFLIVPLQIKKKLTPDYECTRRIKSYNKRDSYVLKEDEESVVPFQDCCWLCDEWQERVFELSLDELVDLPVVNRVLIHLECEEFQGVPMRKPNPKSSKYVTRKMLPEKENISFFFTVNDMQITSDRFLKRKNPKKILKNVRIGEMILPDIEFDELNYLEAIIEERSIEETPLLPGIRKNNLPTKVLGAKVPNIDWNPSSLVQIRPDESRSVIICFESDYTTSRIPNLCQNPNTQLKVRKILLRYYPELKDIYHFLSALGPLSSAFCLNQQGFREFARSCGLVDDRFLRISDIDLVFFTSFIPLNKLQAEAATKSNRFLFRCQFLESLVKLAMDRFARNPELMSLEESLERLIIENILPNFKNIHNCHWRNSRLMTENCEIVIKKNWSFLEHLFKAFSNKKPPVTINPLLSFFEFRRLILESQLINSSFAERDLDLALRMSVSFHPDNLNSDKNRNIFLNFNEFIECIARCAENCGLVPIGEKDTEEKWTFKARSSLSLHVKIEALIGVLLKKHGEKFEKLLLTQSDFQKEINEILGVQTRGSMAFIPKNLKSDVKDDNKTFIRTNLQKSLRVAILINKVSKNLMKCQVRKSIDTPYH